MTTTVFPVLGDSGGYDEVYKYARNLVTYTCAKMGIYGSDQDDVFTDAFMAAIEAQDSYAKKENPTCSLKTWFWTIGQRRVVDGLRSRNWFKSKDVRVFCVNPLPPERGEEDEQILDTSYIEPGYDEFDEKNYTESQAGIVAGALPHLTRSELEWVELMMTGLTQTEISLKLGISQGAVLKRQGSAIRRIQDLIAA